MNFNNLIGFINIKRIQKFMEKEKLAQIFFYEIIKY